MIANFLIFCSGANVDILNQCPIERPKYIGIGAAILITTVFAIISGMYFLAFAFTDKAGQLEISFYALLFFGLLWGLLIFNIDRNIIISLHKSVDGKGEFKQAWMRIILAVFIGIVVSTPLELKLFSDEVEDKIKDNNRLSKKQGFGENYGLYRENLSRLDSNIRVINSDLKVKEARRNSLYESFKTEAEGTGGTFKKGKGPVFAEKKEEFDKIESEYNNMLQVLNNKRHEKDSIVNVIETGNTKISQDKDGVNGIEARIKALYQLSITHWFITLLFIIIEIIPITIKLFSRRGPYDEIRDTKEYEFRMKETKKKEEIQMRIDNDFMVAKTKSELERDATIKAENDKYNSDMKANDEILEKLSKKQSELVDMAADKWFSDAANALQANGI